MIDELDRLKLLNETGVAVIGCGAVAKLYLVPALLRVPGAEIRALIDTDLRQAEQVQNMFRLSSAKTLKSIDDILRDEQVTHLVVATPPKSHAELCIKALESGKKVYCEKPLALSAAEGRLILDAMKRSAGQLSIGFNYRFAAQFKKVKDLIDKGFAGKILSLSVFFLTNASPWPTETGFQFTKEGGGALFETGPHPIDIALWLLGQVKSVSCILQEKMDSNALVEDSALVFLRHSSGSTSVIHVSWHSANYFGMTVVGSNGVMQAERGLDKIRALEFGVVGRNWVLLPVQSPANTSSYQHSLHDFVKGTCRGATPEEAVRNLELVEAAFDSARSDGRWINL